MGDPLLDCSPLINAAVLGKLRLVRLLVEGGAQVNGRNPRGETALLAACKTLRGEPAGPETVKLLTYLLQNKAHPNARDRSGRTALMYACMKRAGPQVALALLSAGADPSMEDWSGASALVYAIDTQHQPTLKVLMEACRARGRDIIIIATETGVNGGPVVRRYLNVSPSLNSSPVSCMSPSDIVLKTGSPNSSEGENVFNFRAMSKRGSSSSCDLSPVFQSSASLLPHRKLSEPQLAVHNQTCVSRAPEEGRRERSLREEEDREDSVKDEEEEDEKTHSDRREGFIPRVSQSVPSLTEACRSEAAQSRRLTPGGSTSDRITPKTHADKVPVSQHRRNTLPSVVVVPPLLHLPPLVNQSDSHLLVSPSSRSQVIHPHPPGSSSSRAAARPALTALAPMPPPAPRCSERRSPRRHSLQLEQIRGGKEQMKRSDAEINVLAPNLSRNSLHLDLKIKIIYDYSVDQLPADERRLVKHAHTAMIDT